MSGSQTSGQVITGAQKVTTENIGAFGFSFFSFQKALWLDALFLPLGLSILFSFSGEIKIEHPLYTLLCRSFSLTPSRMKLLLLLLLVLFYLYKSWVSWSIIGRSRCYMIGNALSNNGLQLLILSPIWSSNSI